MRRTSPLNALQPPYTLANNSINHMDLTAMKQTSVTNLSSNQNASTPIPYSSLPKHWLWDANFFYPTTGSRTTTHENSVTSFLPYPSNFAGFFAANKSKDQLQTTVTHSIRSPSKNNTIDLSSQRSCCSEQNSDSDSLDVSDGQTTPSTSTLQLSLNKRTISSSGKKRNPYSIEELLKKPEKRIRIIEPIAFHPPILIHDRDTSKSPELDVDIDQSDRHVCVDIETNSKSNISIEVCD